MTTIPFDTHKIVKELQEAGFDEPQAEAVVSAMGAAIVGNLATKADMQEFRAATKADMQEHRNATQADIRELRNEFKSGMQEHRAATQADIKEFRSAMQADMQEHRNATQADIRELRNEFKSDMQAMELRIMLRMGGLIVAGVGLIIALDKLV